MPPKKMYRKKKGYRRKRYYKKYPISKPLGRVTTITRNRFVTTIDAPTGALPLLGSFQFAINDLPSYTEFTNLWDEFKICRITLHFVPRYMTNSIGSVAAYRVPMFAYIVDKNDANVPTSLDELLQYPACKVTNGLKTLRISFVPRVSTYLYTGGASGYASKVSYVDCNYPATLHYGFKYYFENTATGGANVICSYNIWASYKIRLRGVR